ncbi:hypothetical protein PWT90_10612 [Aphanocladium album]|nr:hypothetical protein PWT90_10612 [Aphanocladium album]
MASDRFGTPLSDSRITMVGVPGPTFCHKFVSNITAGKYSLSEVTPVDPQGAHSYTVRVGQRVFQFRPHSQQLDVEVLRHVKKIYGALMPECLKEHVLTGFRVYEFPSIAYYQLKLGMTMWGYAMPRNGISDQLLYTVQGFAKYATALDRLLTLLPERFHDRILFLKLQLPRLFKDDWPLAVNNLGISNSTLHVYDRTGQLTSCTSWSHISAGPFGLTASALEHILGGIDANGKWVFVPEHERLRDVFCNTLYQEMGWFGDDRFQLATTLGMFFDSKNGFEGLLHNPTCDNVTVSRDRLAWLDAAVLGIELKGTQPLY